MPSGVFGSTRVRFSDSRAADTPVIRLPANSIEPDGQHRTIRPLDRISRPFRSPGLHLHPLLRRPRWVVGIW